MVMGLMDYYDHDEREVKRMLHSSGPKRIYMAYQGACRQNDTGDEDKAEEDEDV